MANPMVKIMGELYFLKLRTIKKKRKTSVPFYCIIKQFTPISRPLASFKQLVKSLLRKKEYLKMLIRMFAHKLANCHSEWVALKVAHHKAILVD
jgi:hypothetical protein